MMRITLCLATIPVLAACGGGSIGGPPPGGDPPVVTVEASSFETPEDTPLSSSTVVSGSGELVVTMVTEPAHGSVVLRADGSFVYTPSADFNGSDGFAVKAVAGTVESASAMQTVTVTPVNDPPALGSVGIGPGPYHHGEAIVALPEGASDVDGDTVTLSYRWLVNGLVAEGATEASFDGELAVKGDEVQVLVTPSDGAVEGTAVSSATVVIENSAPALGGVSIPEARYGAGDPVSVVPEGWSDVDGDDPGYVVTWYVNDTEVAGITALTLPAGNARARDTVHAVVVPDDGESTGTPVQSSDVTIVNTPPSVAAVTLGDGPFHRADGLRASLTGWSDLDGDPEGAVYGWYVNGALVAGVSGTTLDAGQLHAGDSVYVEATAFDGWDSGNTVTSATVTIENVPPVVAAVSLSPAEVHAHTTITATVEGAADADGDTVTHGYQWYVDGAPLAGATGSSLDGSYVVRGETLFCRVTPNDGLVDGMAVDSPTVTVQNTPPTLAAVTLSPAAPYYETSTLTATPSGATDVDGDMVAFDYQWYVDGVPAEGATASTLDGSRFDKGQSVFCRVTPGDGADQGTAVDSPTVTIENGAPSLASVSLSPPTVFTDDTITATATGASDPDGDPVTLSYEWYVDGSLVAGATGESLDGSHFDKGQVVRCRVTPHDGDADGTPVESPSVTIANGAPSLASVSLSPAEVHTDTTITATVAGDTDPDGDSVEISYRWYVNWVEVQAGATATLDGGWFERDDLVYVEATPSDGTDTGATVASDLVPVANSLPVLASVSLSPEGPYAEGSTLTATPTGATDADGDAVSFRYQWYVGGAPVPGATDSTADGTVFGAADTVFCRVTPSDGLGDGASIDSPTVTIMGAAPVVADDGASTARNLAVVIDVLANDSDPELGSLVVDGVTQGAHGTVVNNGSDVTYTPTLADRFTGADTFTYVARSGSGATATGTVTVQVTPGTLYVVVNGAGARDGSSWSNALATPQQAVSAAVAGEEVWVAQGSYGPAAATQPVVTLAAGVALYGGLAGTETSIVDRPNPPLMTVLDGDRTGDGATTDDSLHVVVGASGGLLDGFVVRGGYAQGYVEPNGGGLYLSSVTGLTVRNTVFTGNRGKAGAAVYGLSSSGILFEGCRIEANAASGASAVYVKTIAGLDIRDSVFVGNHAGRDSGALYLYDVTDGWLERVRFTDNVGVDGGAVYLWNSSPVMREVDFLRNHADPTTGGTGIKGGGGGAIMSYISSSPIISNATFVGNTAVWGGAFYSANVSNPIFTNVSFDANRATEIGGAIYADTGSPPTITNCALWGNYDPTNTGIVDESTMMTVQYSCIAGGLTGGTAIVTLDPVADDPFVRTASDHLLLAPGSACIDAGDDASADAELAGWATSMTRLDELGDVGVVDAGRHYAPGPVVLGFDASPGVFQDHGTTTLSWQTVNAASCSISPDVGELAATDLATGSVEAGATGRQRYTLSCAGLGATATAGASVGTVLYVSPSGDDSSDGSSWATAKATVQAAVDQALEGDQIWVAAGTYRSATANQPVARLREGIGVYGGFAGDETSIEGRPYPPQQPTVLDGDRTGDGATADDSYNVVVGASHTRLDGLVLQHGNAAGSSWWTQNGGGLLLYAMTDVSLSNVTAVNNTAVNGAGIALLTSTATMERVMAATNAASGQGGGMYLAGGLDIVAVTSSRFQDDTAKQGAGAYLAFSRPVFRETDFIHDIATANGGGAYILSAPARFLNVSFVRNDAGSSYNGYGGGGVYTTGPASAPREFVNVTFAANQVNGGGLYSIDGSESVITNTIFSGNMPSSMAYGSTAPHFISYSCLQSSASGTNVLVDSNALVPVDLDGDGLPEMRYLRYAGLDGATSTTTCADIGSDAAADAAGIPWRALSTRSDWGPDTPPVDPGRHY